MAGLSDGEMTKDCGEQQVVGRGCWPYRPTGKNSKRQSSEISTVFCDKRPLLQRMVFSLATIQLEDFIIIQEIMNY